MSAERQYKISCDGPNCWDWVIIKVDTLAGARKEARKLHGWRSRQHPSPYVAGLQDFCPRHRP